MGSLSAPPRAPQTSVVYTAPAAITPTTPQDTTTPTTPAPTASEIRTQNLLQRDRGRLGTITTSLRGLLAPAVPQGQKKTLLGE